MEYPPNFDHFLVVQKILEEHQNIGLINRFLFFTERSSLFAALAEYKLLFEVSFLIIYKLDESQWVKAFYT